MPGTEEQPEGRKAFPASIAELIAEAASVREEVKRLGEQSEGEKDPVSGEVVSWSPDHHPTDAEISELAQRLKIFVPTLQATLLALEADSPFIRPIRGQIQRLPLVASLIDMMMRFFDPVGGNPSLSGAWPIAVHNLTTIIGLLENAQALNATTGEIERVDDSASRPDTGAASGELGKTYKTAIGRNIDRRRRECGWSFNELAKRTGLDKKLILGHVNDGNGTHPSTLKTYADAFSKGLNRPVTVADLET
jgi:hypothetical protein